MDIDALKTFLEVNQCKHFGQAAKNLYLSQSTVSARIKLIEDRVGLPLFIRQRNNLQLTPAGEKLVKYANNIVTTWNRARQDIAINDSQQIPFVAGAQPSLWDSVLVDWLNYLYKIRPDVVINAEVHGPEILARRIQEQTMDIAFVFDNPQLLNFECRQLFDIPLVMVSNKAYDDPLEAINDHYIYVDWGTSFSISHAQHFPELSPPKIRIMLGRIALDYLLCNGGTTYLPEPMLETYLNEQRLFIVGNAPVIYRSVFAIYAHITEQPELIKLSCEFLENKLATRLASPALRTSQ
ncbi:MAG: LysR family transcriptional regulator [Thioalkalispiraceae bacterium]